MSSNHHSFQPPSAQNRNINGLGIRTDSDGYESHRSLLSAQLDASPRSRRPSLVLTTAQEDYSHQSGSHPTSAPGSAQASPRFPPRRAYPTADLSAPSSPSLGLNPDGLPYSVQSPKASPTLVGSPTFQPANHYLSSTASLPTSANTSPRLSPEPTLAPAAGPSTSPRLGTFTEPLGRLANGLVRRGSTQNIKSGGQLPVAHASNAGPRPAPPPPSISLSGLGVGPELTGRRNGYGADIPSRGKKGFGIGLGGSRFGGGGGGGGGHGRMFSWGRVADDPHLKRKLQSQRKWKRKLLIVSIVIAFGIAATRYFGLHDPVSVAQLARPDTRRKSGVRPVRRPEGGGKNFIHPDVIRRTDEMPEGWFHAPMRWFMALYQFDDPRYYSGQVGDRSAEAEPSKRRGLFVPAPHVAFEEHKALPPPPLHSDDPERDTLVLYRILGNDLPPRHSPGQTLRNLRFLLQHESDFSALSHLGPHGEHHAAAYGSGTQARKMHSDEGGLRVDKYFVLNRIAEPSMVSAIVGLLHLYSVPDSRILHIPFEWDEYERREFRWDGGVDKVLGWGVGDGTQKPRDHVSVEDLDAAVEETENHHHRERDERRKRSEMTSRLRALDFTYHEKNLYAMNNNGGRNFALDHGRDLPNARWILPLDGNSFLTPAAMYSIVRTLSVAGEGEGASRYVVIPMARLLSNTDVRASNSIALVPKTHEHELGKSAAEVAELNHQLGAPEALEEPQIGFRYDSTESYQEAMRYGRRSKLELLWRLGAIPYSRRLDSRTLPWEVSDREHITADSWGSIPGYQGLAHGSPVHDAHGNEEDFQPWMAQNPERGPLAFVKAGWVYRLFSGYKSQEQHNSEAAVLRNMNRIKGIVAFLERLDEKVARGQEGCPPDERPGGCGYTPDSLWNFDRQAVDYLRQRFGAKVDQVVGRVQKFEKVASGVHADVSLLDEEDDEALAGCDPHEASINATVLAMAGYVTGNESYSALAATIVTKRFIDEAAVRHAEEYKGARGFSWLKRIAAQSKPGFEEEAVGYAFPAAPFDVRKNPSWNTPEMAKSASKDWPTVPYDPIEFDPTLLLDAVRLLTSPAAPPSALSGSQGAKVVRPLFTAHLAYLLFAPQATALSARPHTAEEGIDYDQKVAALAAYLDDARLLGRVANRARLRLAPEFREDGIRSEADGAKDLLARLDRGLSNVRLRPWSIGLDAESEGGWVGWDAVENSFALLGL